MVKKGGNGNGRNKYNQRGRPNGGGMNDFRNRSQPYSNGQRPTSRFSSAQNGGNSYQPRPYNGNTGSVVNQEQKPSYVPRSTGTTSNYPPKSGSYFDASAANGTANQLRTNSTEQPKYNGYQSKSISNVYGQQATHQSYAPVMTSGIPSLYNLPPPSLPSFNSVQSVPFNYPPPVLPAKN